jgi:hypothetical protein
LAPAGGNWGKKVLRRVKKISHAHIFEAAVSRAAAEGRLIDELLGMLGNRLQPVMSHLIESKRLTLEDVREAERTLLEMERKEKGNDRSVYPPLVAIHAVFSRGVDFGDGAAPLE